MYGDGDPTKDPIRALAAEGIFPVDDVRLVQVALSFSCRRIVEPIVRRLDFSFCAPEIKVRVYSKAEHSVRN